MSQRRTLGEMLTGIAEGTLEAMRLAPDLHIKEVEVSLPVEVTLRRRGDRLDLLGDLPRLLTRTAFDIEPSRVKVVWEQRDEL